MNTNPMVAVFGEAYINLTERERNALCADVGEVLAEMDMDHATRYDAARTLRERIGGVANLRSYVDCLMVHAQSNAGE